MIPGVELIPLVTHTDKRGYFREILKSSQLPKFGQWSMSYMHQNVVKAFHWHKVQTDYWVCISGVIKAVVADLTELRNIKEAFLKLDQNNVHYWELPVPEFYDYILGDNQKPQVLVIPPGVAHGLKVLQGPAVLMYITSHEYDPSDEGRIPYDSLGYNWFRQDIK
jgi:dTDP-4-dehydrorhamnose 3,5-epimerase